MATQGRDIDPTETLPVDIKDELSLAEGTTYTLQVVSGQAIRLVEGAAVGDLPAVRFWHAVPVTLARATSVGNAGIHDWPIDVGEAAIFVDLFDRGGPTATIVVTEAE